MTRFEDTFDADVLKRHKKLSLLLKNWIDVLGVHGVAAASGFAASVSERLSEQEFVLIYINRNLVTDLRLKIYLH